MLFWIKKLLIFENNNRFRKKLDEFIWNAIAKRYEPHIKKIFNKTNKKEIS